MSIAGFGRKISQLRDVGVNGAFAYVSNYLNTIENSFHRRRIHAARGGDARTWEVRFSPTFSPYRTTPCGRRRVRTTWRQLVRSANFAAGPPLRTTLSHASSTESCDWLVPIVSSKPCVWWGVSSAVMLSALDENGRGHLYSVDMPPMDPKRRVEIGAAVPCGTTLSMDAATGSEF